MERVEGWLIDADYETIGGKAVVRLWCKDDQGIFVAYDYNFDPYFYVIGVDEDILKNAATSTRREVIKLKSFEKAQLKTLGREVEGYIVYAHHPQHVPKLRDYLSQFGDVREADIPFAYRYLIDKDLACMDGIAIEGEKQGGVIRSYKIEKVERIPRMEFPELKMLVFDCEMLSSFGMPEPEKDPIIVISVKTNDDDEIILTGDERKIISDFVKLIKSYDPDIIVGYNQDAFDWPYLRKRAERWNIPLDVGRDGSNVVFRGGRPKITGRLNVDLYDIAMRISDIKIKKLENVAEFLGTKIEIADIEAKDIYRYWSRGEKEKVLNYARQDAINTYLIAKELLPMHYELSKMIRLPVDDVTRMGRGKQVDWLLLSEAKKIGEIAPNPPEHAESYEGAFVLEPERGLHENVACLDFASMYPSIMIAFNISPDTYGCRDDCYEAPEVGHKFRKSPDGFFKRILRMLIEKRRELKVELKNLSPESSEYKLLDIKQQTLKVLTNSFYGYMGWNLARWYCHPCAEATTAWGRHFIRTSAKIAESMGFKVLYGDTDSIFVTKAGMTKEDVDRLIDKLHEELPIQIEVDEYYSAIFFVEKKRYAGLTEDGRLVVKGLEVRRGDWCELAKKVQREVIEVILKEKNPEKALSLVKDVILRIKEGKVSLEEVVIYKGLTKKPSKYESMQAHVKAALKAREMGIIYPVSSKIGYVIVKGSGNIGDRAYPIDLIEDFDGENLRIKTKSGIEIKKLDKDYYIDNQIIPSVLRILERFGYTEASLKGSSQMSLDSFFS
ncbi:MULTISPECIES: DNA-directed DNA polymerase [Archaeoglobus]|jgi:DNA polymerase I|uniref:DNA polymerase n=3 Tax=Archaeoglobus fulgidus TaxID=2234 RepID=DPOL_ARCFU|nr:MULTISPECIES: DNA-directed DNA polymerase [Archaeoglobus]O29753.1 RecName: Full=DNA polymerase [Archaeoglobus fulgidus DSM 4304]AAB90741.1 DNA polymerase B1 (polB) [Archaeoglobus fulgidus DSM 4304]AIG97314.1 DNA polymerase (pol2) [Archaeoglobus fulgidus DSM 8774]KUJ92614.1 MAG: DNA polymerase [Archaeoglobus fulgidus]KUK05767.1 MAG: DNA polymerase [Archaeoglobus fulgidus]MDI3496983.1 polymerase, archaea type [Archaeoglobus sp.]